MHGGTETERRCDVEVEIEREGMGLLFRIVERREIMCVGGHWAWLARRLKLKFLKIAGRCSSGVVLNCSCRCLRTSSIGGGNSPD
jgi:hypothetical protein